MRYFICISLLSLLTGFAQANDLRLTCDNYKTMLTQSKELHYPPGKHELDCHPQATDDLLYTSHLDKVDAHQPINIQPEVFRLTTPYQKEANRLDRNLIPRTDAELIEQYLFNTWFTQFNVPKAALQEMAIRFIVNHIINLPNTPVETLLDMVDGRNCGYMETIYDFYTRIRFSEAIEHIDGTTRAWFLGSCQGKGATLFIQQPTVANGQVQAYPVGSIDSDFTRLRAEASTFIEIRDGIRGMSADGQTILLGISTLDFNKFIKFRLYVTSQLDIRVYKQGRLLTIPTQKFIQHEHGISARLSADGNSVVIATPYQIKWFKYQPDQDQFVLVGLYQHPDPEPLASDTLALTTADHQIYIESLSQKKVTQYLIHFN